MEDWKVTIAEGVVSYSKSGKKNVKVVTKDKKTGGEVAKAVLTGVNASYPLSTDFKGITRVNPDNTKLLGAIEEILVPGIPTITLINAATGSGYKEFFVKTGSKQAQDEFIERLGKVIAEVNEYKNSTPVAVTSGGNDSDTRRNNILLIAAAVLIIAAIVWALWK